MPTSPAVLANNTYFVWNSVNLSGDLSQATLSMNNGEIDTSVFGITGWREYITSISDATLDVVGFHNKASNKTDSLFFAELGAPTVSRAWELDVPNSSVGSVRYTGQAWLKSYKVDSKVNDAVRANTSIRVTGAITRAVIAS